MVPDVVMILARLPLTLNGKLDRRALPAPVFGATANTLPRKVSVEVTVEQICARVLGVERVSVVESVFDVGGNSMLAARIVARVCDEFGVDLNLRDLFDEPTVRGLAVRVARANAGLPAVTAVSPRPERIPLSFAQARMWFRQPAGHASSAYNIPLVLRITGTLDVEGAATGGGRRRHPSRGAAHGVRTHRIGCWGRAGDDQPCQLIADPESITGQLDWSVVEDRSGIDEAVGRGFDVSTNWPIRVRVCRTGVAEHLLAIVVHHIAADGESLAPLVSDLLTAYGARTRGAVPDIEPLAVQMADYAIWQREVLGTVDDVDSVIGRQFGYWREQLAGYPMFSNSPRTGRADGRVGRGDRVGFEIPFLSAAGSMRWHAGGVTPFMVVHAGLAVLLARLSASGDIAIATPIAGRGQAALDPVVGMFVNTLVLRTAVSAELTMDELLDCVKATDLDAFAHADVPFENIVEQLVPHAGQAYEPLAQVMLSFNPTGDLADLDLTCPGSRSVPWIRGSGRRNVI